VLGLPLNQAQQVGGVWFREATGVAVQGLPRILGLVHVLLAPPSDRDDLVGAVPEPEFGPPEDPDVFSQEQWEAADRLLRVDGVPRRLSGLLAEARALDPQLPHLVALRVVHAVDPGLGAALPQGDRHALVAVDDGTPLDDPQFGGSDLLVSLATLETVPEERAAS
jgi:hypothetical protein